MIIVSDASPLTNLAQIGRLDLLEKLFSRVIIPEAVARELSEGELRGDHPRFLGLLSWIEVRRVSDSHAVDQLLAKIDLGEAEAIALAVELGGSLLLVDERAARRLAAQKGIKTTGVLGVLLGAKRAGLISEVKPVLDQLLTQAGFWIADRLYRETLVLAGETP